MRISDWSSDVCLPISRDRRDRLLDRLRDVERHHLRAMLHVRLGEPRRTLDVGDDQLRLAVLDPRGQFRSEERRVGKEGVSSCRSWWSAYHYKKKNTQNAEIQST